MLILDDLHWADAPSLRLLEFLAPELSDNRLLLLGSYRGTELSRQHPLSNALGGLARVPHFARVNLSGLNAAEVGQFVTATAGHVPPPGLAEVLCEQTEGNPLFLREIVRFLEQRGVLAAGLVTPQEGFPSVIRIPEGVREVIGRRLNMLSPGCNEVLALASVIGRDFGSEVLRLAAAPLDQDMLIEALDEAVSVHVVEETMPGHYQFTHNLIRMTLYDELRTAHRRQFHRAVGNAIQAHYRTDLDAFLPELARHFHLAGTDRDLELALEYATRAGRRADTLLAFEDAVQFFQAALDVMEQNARVDEPAHCGLLLLLGEALRKSADFPRAQTTLRKAAEMAQRLGLPNTLAHAALAYEQATYRSERSAEAPPERLLSDALRLVPEDQVAMRIELLGGFARSLLHAGAVDEAREQLATAIALARQLGEPHLLAVSLYNLFNFPSGPEDTPELLARATETLEAAERAGDADLVSVAHTRRLVFLMELGDVGPIQQEINQLTRINATIRQPIHSVALKGFTAMLALMRGDLEGCERLIARAMQQMPHTGASQMAFLSVQIFTLYREQGRLKAFLPAVLQFAQHNATESTWRPGLALLWVELDRMEDARTEFNLVSAQDFSDLPRDGRWTTCIAYLTEVCAALGDVAKAQVLYRLLLPYAGRILLLGGGVACAGASERYLGLLCSTMLRWEEAERYFDEALYINSRLGAQVPLAHTQHDYAAMLLTRGGAGNQKRARALLNTSRESAELFGMRALAQRIADRLDELQAPQPPRAGADELTAREIEVLGLIAIGRSNADISLALSISPNTVATHVRSILAKTGCANWTEAAAHAMRYGLTASPPV